MKAIICKSTKEMREFRGNVALYKLTPPYQGNNYVLVSSIDNEFGRETMLFSASKKGVVTDWGELACIRELNHTKALKELGYKLAR